MVKGNDEYREKIFSAEHKKIRTKEITVWGGLKIELRQPTVTQISDLTANMDTDDGAQMLTLRAVIQFAYVPGGNERVFDSADLESLASMPFDENMSALLGAMNELTSINVEAQAKNSESGPSDTSNSPSQ